jgi:hypothetical protein
MMKGKMTRRELIGKSALVAGEAILAQQLVQSAIADPANNKGENANPTHPNTDWFLKAGFGVFTHYLNGIQNNREQLHSLGKETDWDTCVNEFDTERYADTMHEVGAGYVIFTIMQLTKHMIAPNETYDRITGYKPGEACARRDLVEDLYKSLSKRNIPLMLYYTGDGPSRDSKAGPAFGCGTPVTTEFVRKWASVVEEYGLRYGKKVAGYWTDGCYPFIGYDDEKLGIMAKGLKAGNPDRIIALNRGVDPKVMSYTRHEDFTAGEQNRFWDMPASRWIDGEQWHILSFLGPNWAQPGCGYTKEQLAQYVNDVHDRGGVVSIDAMLYRDGLLDRSQVELLKAVRPMLRSNTSSKPTPPGNVAFHKPSKLLSLDGSHELVVNSDIHFPRLGVDGDPNTYAQAAEEYPWTYEVYLVDLVPLRRIRVIFGPGYATQFDIRISTDGTKWTTVASQSGWAGKPFEVTIPPTPASYIRVCGIKPDGPNQPGAQMSIAELQAFK